MHGPPVVVAAGLRRDPRHDFPRRDTPRDMSPKTFPDIPPRQPVVDKSQGGLVLAGFRFTARPSRPLNTPGLTTGESSPDRDVRLLVRTYPNHQFSTHGGLNHGRNT